MPRAIVDITPAGQRPDEDPSLAARNNGGAEPSSAPAPAGRREALLLLSFGGPEGHDDVMPFLENVTRGRGIPRERLEEVAEHYHHFGGVSPINDQNKALLAALEDGLRAAGIDLPVYWGNRNWAPYVEDVWQQMADDGIEHAYVLATSAYASFSGCRQYHEDVARARAAMTGDAGAPGGPTAEKLPHYFDAEGFVRANADALAAALAGLPDDVRDGARLVATAHSIPDVMAAVAGPDGHAYEAELQAAARLVVDLVAPGRPVDLVWQSRSGPPSVPWLEPDVNDHLRGARGGGGEGRRPLPGRLRQRPPRGDLGPRQRGEGDRRGARAGLRPRRDGRHPPGVRRRAGRAAGRAPGRRRAATGHQLPRELLLRPPWPRRHPTSCRPPASCASCFGGPAGPLRSPPGATVSARWARPPCSSGGRTRATAP